MMDSEGTGCLKKGWIDTVHYGDLIVKLQDPTAK